jgi:hypothetical protein
MKSLSIPDFPALCSIPGVRPAIGDEREYTTARSANHCFEQIGVTQTNEVLLILADRHGVREKRTEKRIPLMARVDILWMDDELTPRVTPATLEDRSHGGVSLRMKNSISLGSHITIKSGTIQYSGIVTNSRRDKSGFMVGVKLLRRQDPNSK